jgi:DNA (cytosine-5)-methyltransferase 1
MPKIKVATVFSGIGALEFALKRMDLDHEIVFACDSGEIEIDIEDPEAELSNIKKMRSFEDKREYVDNLYATRTRKTNFVRLSYLANYSVPDGHFHQDARMLDGNDYEGQVDLLVGGSPCQSFSTVGFQKGLEDTRGTLFHEFARLIKEINPKVFIFENVRGFFTHDNKNTWNIARGVFDSLRYHIHPEILNSKDYGIPQNRRRVFVIGFKEEADFVFPAPIPLGNRTMKDFLEDHCAIGGFTYRKGSFHKGQLFIRKRPGSVDRKYILSEKVKKYVMSSGTKTFYSRPKIDLDIARPLLKTMGNRHRAGIDNYVSVGEDIRMLTEREALRLMGFTDDFKIVVSRANIYKQAGNAIVVDVLMALLESIIETGVLGQRSDDCGLR